MSVAADVAAPDEGPTGAILYLVNGDAADDIVVDSVAGVVELAGGANRVLPPWEALTLLRLGDRWVQVDGATRPPRHRDGRGSGPSVG